MATILLTKYEFGSEYKIESGGNRFMLWLEEQHPELISRVKKYINVEDLGLQQLMDAKQIRLQNQYPDLNKEQLNIISKSFPALTTWIGEIIPILIKTDVFPLEIIILITKEILDDNITISYDDIKNNLLADISVTAIRKESIRTKILTNVLPEIQSEDKDLSALKTILKNKLNSYIEGWFCHHKDRAVALLEVIKSSHTVGTISACLKEQKYIIFLSKRNNYEFGLFTQKSDYSSMSCYDRISQKTGNGWVTNYEPLISECLEEVDNHLRKQQINESTEQEKSSFSK